VDTFAHAVGLMAKYGRKGGRWIIVQLIIRARPRTPLSIERLPITPP